MEPTHLAIVAVLVIGVMGYLCWDAYRDGRERVERSQQDRGPVRRPSGPSDPDELQQRVDAARTAMGARYLCHPKNHVKRG